MGGGLIAAGVVSTRLALTRRRSYLALAVLPLLFGVQQLAEGVVWLRLLEGDVAGARPSALAFMFFSHFFWLFWVPLGVAMSERVAWRRRLFWGVTAAGFLFGAGMWVPLVLDPGLPRAEIVQSSIFYGVDLIYDGVMPRDLSHALYAFFTLFALLAASDRRLVVLGGLMAVSAAGTLVFFLYAFASVWCFFAAFLSLYVIDVVRQGAGHAPRPVVAKAA